ncbi:MAG: hypothetical protein CMH28_02310 [Micavibrio sp.]|nr:hypothetical protein [Micavibrio sp.]
MKLKKTPFILLTCITLLFLIYTSAWFGGAKLLENAVTQTLQGQSASGKRLFDGQVSKVNGYPGAYRLEAQGRVITPNFLLKFPEAIIKGWPIPGTAITADFQKGLQIILPGQVVETFDNALLEFTMSPHYPKNINNYELMRWYQAQGNIHIKRLTLVQQDIRFDLSGDISLDEDLQPIAQLTLALTGKDKVIEKLVKRDILTEEQASLVGQLASKLASENTDTEGEITAKMVVQNNAIYYGPLRIMSLPEAKWE